MLAKRFFYVSAALFLLAVTYHLGASRADAQAPGNPIVGVAGVNSQMVAMCANGDSYRSGDYGTTWQYHGNVFGGLPTGATPTTMGRVKDAYRR